MKSEARTLARDLRRQGLSLNEIAMKLGVAKSSVSLWVRDIQLTQKQTQELLAKNPVHNHQHIGARKKHETYLELRRSYQEAGRRKAQENNMLHMQGCMLYWAEGAKSKNKVKFVNSDVNMMQIFVRFLRECYHVQDSNMKVCIYCYTSNGLPLSEIEDYWLSQLDLPHASLWPSVVDRFPSSSQGKSSKKNKLQYGVCHLQISSTELVQNIYGAIQEYCSFTEEKWLG